MKPSRFVAFLALFSILFISPVPSNAAGVRMPMNNRGINTVMRVDNLADANNTETTCMGRALQVVGGILAVVFFFSGLWIPLGILFIIGVLIWAAVRYIITGKSN